MNRCLTLLPLLVLGGCVSPLDREYCGDRSVEEARALVKGAMADRPGTEFIECFVVPKSASVHGCALRIDPADFEALFASRRLGPEGPPPDPKTSYSADLARRLGFEIVGTRFVGDEREALSVHFNAARDRIVVVFREYNCHSLREVVS